MSYDLNDENSIEAKLISGKITKSEFMEISVGRGYKEKRAFEYAERLLYDRNNRMPNLRPRNLVIPTIY